MRPDTARLGKSQSGFLLSAPMKFPEPLESRFYRDPMEVVSARQSEEANRAKRQAQDRPQAKRPTLTAKPRAEGEWSDARKAAEALFDLPKPSREA